MRPERSVVEPAAFGFYEGFNKGQSLGFFGTDLSAQFGARFLQANLSEAGFTNDVRNQAFVTSGLFRRVDYGFQFGVVVDHLYDDWYFRGNVTQLRGELSWVTKGSGTFGFLWSAGIDDDTSTTSVLDDNGAIASTQLSFEAISQYNFFYRQRLARCGMLEAFIGGSDNDETILGMNLDMPIHSYLMLNTSVNYLIPDDEMNATPHFDESLERCARVYVSTGRARWTKATSSSTLQGRRQRHASPGTSLDHSGGWSAPRKRLPRVVNRSEVAQSRGTSTPRITASNSSSTSRPSISASAVS